MAFGNGIDRELLVQIKPPQPFQIEAVLHLLVERRFCPEIVSPPRHARAPKPLTHSLPRDTKPLPHRLQRQALIHIEPLQFVYSNNIIGHRIVWGFRLL